MNIQDYLQMVQMNPNPTPGPAPQGQEVPRGTSDPLGAGSAAGISAAKQAMGGMSARGESFRPFVNILQNALSASMSASKHPGMQAMGKAGYDPYAAYDANMEKNAEIVKYLRATELARQDKIYKALHLQEQARHNQASEESAAARAKADSAQNFFETDSGDHVQDMRRMKPSILLNAQKEIKDYTSKANASLDGLEIVQRMEEIAEKTPEIMNSWGYIMANKNNDNPTFWNQTALRIGVQPEQQALLMEMANLSKRLAVMDMKMVPVRALNMVTDKLLIGNAPSAKMPLATFKQAAHKLKQGFKYGYDEYTKGSDYGQDAAFYMPKSRHMDELTKHKLEKSEAPPANVEQVTIDNMTKAQKQQRLEQINAMEQKAPEEQQ